jgi:REP element-mobilizing transposase RayT
MEGRSSIVSMPREARLDAPGTLHHVMARGIEGTDIFRTDEDRNDFLNRLADQCEAETLKVYAWALIPNHFHLLVRTGNHPIFTSMRKILTGYAVKFNLRYRRHGHLFQNRYKSIVCEEDPYLLELTRYIHLNPIRAGIVGTMQELGRYPWAGHSAILGRVKREWQDAEEILRYFGTRQRVTAQAEGRENETLRLRRKVPDLGALVKEVAKRQGVGEEKLKMERRTRDVVKVMKLICQLAVRKFGYTGANVARFLGVTTSLVNRYAASEELPEFREYA